MGAAYLQMSDIAAVYGVHLRTARRWASTDKWRRTTGSPVTYSMTDAQRSYEQRRHGRAASHLAERYGAGAS